jgi:hypothetical protein
MATEQRTKISAVWQWLRDAENRKVIAWIGSGVIVLLGAVLYQNAGTGPPSGGPSSNVTVGNGIGAGGDVTIHDGVTINGGPEDDAGRPQD